MRVLLRAIILLVGTIAAATFTGAKINLRRCADAKIENHDVMLIVVASRTILVNDLSCGKRIFETPKYWKTEPFSVP